MNSGLSHMDLLKLLISQICILRKHMEHGTAKSLLSKYGIALFVILYLSVVAVLKSVSAPHRCSKGRGTRTKMQRGLLR